MGWLALALSLLSVWPAQAQTQQDPRKSGFAYMGRDTQAMQQDDLANPAMLTVLEGEALWTTPAGKAGKSCAACHGEARESMKGVAARYPSLDEASGKPIDLSGRIAQCRETRMEAAPWVREGRDMLA